MDTSIFPEEWDVVEFGEVVDSSLYGYTSKSSEEVNDMPILRITDINENGTIESNGLEYVEIDDEEVEKYKLKPGDLVIARSGATVGQSYLYTNDDRQMVYASYLIRFRVNTDRVLPRFVENYLHSGYYWDWVERTKRVSDAGAKANINASELKSLPIPIPPIEQQEYLVEIMDSTRKKVQEMQEDHDISSRIEESILKSIIREKIPKENIPDGWEREKLKDIGEIYSGGTPKRDNDDYFGGDIPWVRLKDAKSDYAYETQEYLTDEGLNNSSAQLLPEGTVIVSTRATIGEITIAGRELTTNQGFKSIKPQNSVPEFVAYYLSSIVEEMENLARTTTYPEVNKTQFSNIEIPLPPVEEQEEIVNEINGLKNKIDSIHESSDRKQEIIELLPKSILNKGFRGEIQYQGDGEDSFDNQRTVVEQHKLEDY